MKRVLVVLSLLMASHSAWSESPVSDEVFARIGDAVLTQDMLDAAFSRIPEEHRLAFIRDSKKVDQLVKQILTNMLLAEQARAAGFDENPLVAGRAELAVNKALTEAWIEHRSREAPEPDFEALAREYYVLNPDEFMTPLTYDVTHILIKAEIRTEDEALKLAEKIRGELVREPELFDARVGEYSESRDAAQSGGRLVGVKRGQAVEPFEEAALALKPGEISDVVRTEFGYHVIRLDSKQEPEKIPFEDVRQSLISVQKTRHLENARTRVVTDAISVAPLEFPEGAIERMLKRHFGENLEKAPDYQR